LHPIHVFDEEVDLDEYEKLIKHPKVVAIGEIGLDYYRIPEEIVAEKFKNKQKEILEKFNSLSEKTGLPMIIHCREAHDDLIKFFENKKIIDDRKARGVMHCFSGNSEEAKKYLDFNFLISFTGVITFKKYNNEALRAVPLDKLMVETDCPYLAPEPYRGERNEPLYVKYIAEKVAEVKGMSYEEVEQQTTENALRFFLKTGVCYNKERN
jgi:TatD DNase family protein